MTAVVECPLCLCTKARSLFSLKGVDVVECSHCHLIYQPTAAPEFVALYREDYGSAPGADESYSHYQDEIENHLIMFNRRLEECEALVRRKGRLLDVGCALGHLGEAAKRRGWDAYLADVSEFAVIESRKKFGSNGFISGPEKLPVKAACFDLITMYDVIEHVSHPMDLLRDVKRALSSDGLLHVTTPNMASLSSRLMGSSWYYIKPERRFLYFTPATLSQMLHQCGFEVLKVKAVPMYYRLSDLLLRLERYSKTLAQISRVALKALGLLDLRVCVYAGKMQAWARPMAVRTKYETRPVKDILDIVCCPKCGSEIQLFEETEAICTQCELQFEVTAGVINFSKYAKRTKRQVAGHS